MTALEPNNDLMVNGERVPLAIIAAEVQNHNAPRDRPYQAWEKAVQAITIRTVLLQEAKRRGIGANRAQLGPGQMETEDDSIIRLLLEDAIDVTPPSEADVKDAWERDPSRFKSPPLWEVSHILIACDSPENAAHEKASAKAEAILKSLRVKPDDFNTLAKDVSDCPSRSNAGFIGQVGPDDLLPEFAVAIRDLQEGELCPDVIKTKFGYHIARMDGVAERRVLPFEVVQPKLSEAIEKARWAKSAREFVASLMADAEISGAEVTL